MPIRSLDTNTVARGRLNALRFTVPVADAARALASWQAGHGGLLVPIAIPLPKPTEESPKSISFFRQRAKLVRAQIAKKLGLEGDAALKLSFTMSSKDAWYLGPRPKLDVQTMLDAVAGSPGKFIELMLLKELIECSALDAEDTFVGGGFGPGVYLGSASQASKKFLQLAQAEYAVNTKHGLLLCDVTAKRFSRKVTARAESAASTRLASAGEGFLVGVTRIVPDEFYEHDGRKSPMEGLRSGPACLNSFPRFLSGFRAGCQRCRVVHGGGRRLRRTHAAVGNSGRTRDLHLTQPTSAAADPRSTLRRA